MANKYIYEFLYRGFSEDSGRKPEFHVQLAVDVEDVHGNKIAHPSAAMTLEQAEELGVSWPDILKEINSNLMKYVHHLKKLHQDELEAHAQTGLANHRMRHHHVSVNTLAEHLHRNLRDSVSQLKTMELNLQAAERTIAHRDKTINRLKRMNNVTDIDMNGDTNENK